MTALPDLHTHRAAPPGAPSLLNLQPGHIAPSFVPREGCLYTAGWHPFSLPARLEKSLEELRHLAALPSVRAIGECGLDRLSPEPMERQMLAFRMQAMLAEEMKKPLILHVVRALDLMLSVHKEMRPRMEWIMHGFRGRPATAAQLIRAGISLSFGTHFNEDSVAICPTERLYVETDEAPALTLPSTSEKVARLKSVPVKTLAESIMSRGLFTFL